MINTKFGHSETGEINFKANSIRESLRGSLKRLQIDYIDCLILHFPAIALLNGINNLH